MALLLVLPTMSSPHRHARDSRHAILQLLLPAMMVVTMLLSVSVVDAEAAGLTRRQETRDQSLLYDVINSLERMTEFFGKDYSSVNVDGLFGIRVGQGSVNQSISDCSSPLFHCPPALVTRLERLNGFIENIASHALPYVEQQDPAYFRHFLSTIDSPYILEYHTEVIQAAPPGPPLDKHYNEEGGDKCLSQLMGSYDGEPKCTISDSCWSLMTEENTGGYKATHQLLYFIIGDKTHCIPAIRQRFEAMGETSLRQHETELCTHILAEAQALEHNGQVPLLRQDLFLEQSMLCGILGFQNFMQEAWVRMVLSWQNAEGCYTMSSPSLGGMESAMELLQGEERRLLSLMKSEADAIDRNGPGTGRKLLREHFMAGSCLAHKTGLAFSLVGAYIRNLIHSVYGQTQKGM